MSDFETAPTRRRMLQCMAYGGAGTLFALTGGVLTPIDLALAATGPRSHAGTPLFVQISDTHIGFNKEANPDVAGTLRQTIALINAMPAKPAFIVHTGDITHLSKAEEFDNAAQLISNIQVRDLHTVPGEHDVTDGTGTEYFKRFGNASNGKGYYSFDQAGVHFVALNNVMSFKPGGLGQLGPDQLAWLEQDLRARGASTPIVVFGHIPLWNVYEPWGWGTGDATQALALLKRFGSVTVLNGHIHQIVSKVEGNVAFHTARSTAYPQPAAGVGPGPGPLKVPADQLPKMLGLTSVSIKPSLGAATLTDTTLG
jgi:3',5'-cyclic AMP phosphodiesterase CpdA